MAEPSELTKKALDETIRFSEGRKGLNKKAVMCRITYMQQVIIEGIVLPQNVQRAVETIRNLQRQISREEN